MYILPRANEDTPDGSNLYFIAIIVLALVVAIIITFFVLRHLRIWNYQPKLIPGKYLKGVWRRWTPGSTSYNAVPNGTAQLAEANGRDEARQSPREAALDRNTSIRSVMTLPSYTITPKASERVIAREGERDGMDVVVEFPETAEEEEQDREEQMESLYQIRLARRREIAEREEARQQRREARERGDWARVEELRRESRARAEANRLQSQSESPNGSSVNVSAATLLAEHQSRGRERRVSSVSYADIGHVRHDGTRLFSSSPDSDSRGLLESAAGMGSSPLGAHIHQRTTSASSLLSNTTNNSDAESFGTATGPTALAGEADLGMRSIPPPYDAVGWGDAPPYQPTPPNEVASEVFVVVEHVDHAPRLPPLSTLPSIAIEVATPTSSAPPTPISRLQTPSPVHSATSAPR
ncbi:uncharacterized protein GIQ15_06208 [Arthroderma uncinatum]|uniref:uncharacterized protein n=1 Tax=Arthroderma uncinatum TaxID=74035 RepID=UPI00144AC6B2|nr:uncharacterized protein GIQ15_06208 [Arthroderma uncinatum]KAF3480861.1 hypothetical protein GIQ15_06208 [Arthroderma uncinatum]